MKNHSITAYITVGMLIGLFLGSVVSTIFFKSDFVAIVAPGFGFFIGLVVGVVVWSIKEEAE